MGLIKEAAAYGGGSVEETVATHGYSVGASVAMDVAVAVLIACSSQAARSVHFFPFSFRLGSNNEREDDKKGSKLKS